MGKSKIKQVQPKSQATPLATDVLNFFRGQINPQQPSSANAINRGMLGAAQGPVFGGMSAGPAGQQGGTAIQQFLSSGGPRFETTDLFKNLQDMFRMQQGQDVAQLREQYSGLAGGGGGLSTGSRDVESDYLARSGAEFGGRLGEISRQEFANQQNRLGGVIQGLFGLSGQGILPQQTVVEPSLLQQGAGLLGGLGGLGMGIPGLIQGGKALGGLFRKPKGPTLPGGVNLMGTYNPYGQG